MATNRQESIEKIRELTEGIDFCMLTTIDGSTLRSRPMSTQKFEFDGDLWFFTDDHTHKIDEIEKLWSPILKAWFPEGLEDPSLCLLKIPVEQAEYWDAPSSKIVQLFGMVKAIATGQEADYGENKKIDLG